MHLIHKIPEQDILYQMKIIAQIQIVLLHLSSELFPVAGEVIGLFSQAAYPNLQMTSLSRLISLNGYFPVKISVIAKCMILDAIASFPPVSVNRPHF